MLDIFIVTERLVLQMLSGNFPKKFLEVAPRWDQKVPLHNEQKC